MYLTQTYIYNYIGKSTEEKPVSEKIPDGSFLRELDTGEEYIYKDREWYSTKSVDSFAIKYELDSIKKKLKEVKFLLELLVG